MCHGQFWGKPCLSEQGIVSCEVTLEVIGYMYPGSGLQTGTGCSEFGLKRNFFIETEDKWKVFSLSYTIVQYKSVKRASAKNWFLPKRASAKNWFLLKRASALATKTNTMVQWKYLIKEHQHKELRIPLKEHQHLKHNLSQNYGLGGWGGR